jgi:D-alanyl-D-alanine carboxypeptidase
LFVDCLGERQEVFLNREHKRKHYVSNSDKRLDLSPSGRNMFVSQDKQQQDKTVRRLHFFSRVVLVLLAIVALCGIGLFIFGYMVPYFQSEFSVSSPSDTDTSSVVSNVELSSQPTFDAMGLPVYGDEISLAVVNADSPAGPEDVPSLTEVEGIKVNEKISDALTLLVSTAKEEGLSLTFDHGYISYEQQDIMFQNKVEELQNTEGLTTVMARVEAEEQVPPAGECDDQSGMCITLSADIETFGDSQTYSWLKNNMGKFGFVFRYPEGKEDLTHHKADPRVIRYVGSEHAAAMQQRSMCLEEYISYLASQ